MQDILLELSREDYAYLIQIIRGPFDRCVNLRKHLEDVDSPGQKEILCAELERKIRYLGSSDIAYQFRRVIGAEPGADFRYIIRDTARFLKVPLADRGTERDMLIQMAQEYAVNVFSKFTQTEQEEILESLGVKRKHAIAFLKKAGGIFAVPALLQAFGTLVVEGLIKTVLFGWTARLIGAKLAASLFFLSVCPRPVVDAYHYPRSMDNLYWTNSLASPGTCPAKNGADLALPGTELPAPGCRKNRSAPGSPGY